MKRSIEWVDDLFDGSREEHILPSEVQDLVQQVRREALDTVELWVHKYKNQTTDPAADLVLEYMLKMIDTCREQNK